MDRARKLEPLAKLEPLNPRRPSMMDPAFMKDAIPLVPAGARPSKGPCVCSGDSDHGGMRWRKLASDAERQAMRFFVEKSSWSIFSWWYLAGPGDVKRGSFVRGTHRDCPKSDPAGP